MLKLQCVWKKSLEIQFQLLQKLETDWISSQFLFLGVCKKTLDRKKIHLEIRF